MTRHTDVNAAHDVPNAHGEQDDPLRASTSVSRRAADQI